MNRDRTLQELFSLPGFRENDQLQGKFGDPNSRVVVLSRQKKLPFALHVGNIIKLIMIVKNMKHVILTHVAIVFTCGLKDDVYFACGAKVCV